MEKLNDLTRTAIARIDAMATVLKNEEGSEVAQAAGVAMVAAALIGVVLGAGDALAGAVGTAFARLTSLIH